MPRLMLQISAPDEERPATRIGGRPLAPVGTQWPTCESCKGPMQFLAQVRLVDVGEPGVPPGLLLLFHCRNKPGQCNEWDPTSGGNVAMRVVERGAVLLDPPVTSRKTLLDDMDGVKFAPLSSDYATIRDRDESVLGYLGGAPVWTQGDETPACGKCKKSMRFVVQLEERGGGGIVFGDGGAGYGFVCSKCPEEARFLWQAP
jgi:uncharacterized protein YwqG